MSAGIYKIEHLPSKSIYIGQSNNLDSRISSHKLTLRKGKHSNQKLQDLWTASDESDFIFEICIIAPKALSPLELQRWLVAKERESINHHRNSHFTLNKIEPEIVATKTAIKEYQAEKRIKNKENDKRISQERKKIKGIINHLGLTISPKRSELYRLRELKFAAEKYIKKHTGWRSLFYGGLPYYQIDELKMKLSELEKHISDIKPEVQKVECEIRELKLKYKRLYGYFSKVAKRGSYNLPRNNFRESKILE